MSDRFTYEELAAVLHVDSGNLIWRVTRGKARAGLRAGRQDKQGYIVLQYKGIDLQAHRVVWFLTHGCWPVGMVDHKNGRRDDNHPDNLRECDNARNQQNAKPRHGKFKGVVRLPHGRFQAQCGKSYLGSFDTDVEAALAYDAEAEKR